MNIDSFGFLKFHGVTNQGHSRDSQLNAVVAKLLSQI